MKLMYNQQDYPNKYNKGVLILPIVLYPHKSRVITFYSLDDPCVPKELFKSMGENAEFKPVYPIPFRKKYFKYVKKAENTYYVAGEKGLFRYCDSEKEVYDRVMYFSADRDLKDNNVQAFFVDGDNIWVRTETAVSRIELRTVTMEQKAEMLREETCKYIDRKGMISNKLLDEPWNIESARKFGHSDNDGGFTAEFCMGEIFHYAYLKREKGADHPETVKIRKVARRALDACMLLMYIHGRGDGFVCRSYVTTDAPLPDDGLFMHRCGDTATVVETTDSKRKGYVGRQTKIVEDIPKCFSYLFEDEGYTVDDIIFKCDTSSDEITLQLFNLYYAHMIFGEEENELDSYIKDRVSKIINHILDNGHELKDFHGGSTCWAKWSKRYFESGIGWCDAPLNCAELLMYLKLGQAVCGYNEKWQKEYEALLADGYEKLCTLHYDRVFGAAIMKHCDYIEDIMYGDHMLSNLTFFGLTLFEDDERLKEIYYKGWQSWRATSLGKEHHPVYDVPFALNFGCDEYFDEEKIKMWFYRTNCGYIASGTSLVGRRDVATKEYRAGYRHTSYLLPPDERYISKQDRDPWEYKNEDSHGNIGLEMCTAYTFPYWMGRYYGIIVEGGEENA